MSKKTADSEVYFESLTEDGKPLFITVQISFYQDETNETSKGSRLFWTYEIMEVRACFRGRDGGPEDYTGYLDKEHMKEIEAECNKELESFKEAA